MMDEFKRLNQDIYNDFVISCRYFVRNHGSDERNKKMARKIARRRLKMKDGINLKEKLYE